MKFYKKKIEGLYLIKPNVFEDVRGVFRRSFCSKEMKKVGIDFVVCQGNISENKKKFTMRGFHYQKSPSLESKILTPVSGAIYNVVIDLRKDSKTFLKSVSFELRSQNRESIHVPYGCGNAFLTLESNTIVHYYMGDHFKEETYSGFKYNDPFFNINWPYEIKVISERDNSFSDFNVDNL
jgi:dTDP-4-dehydrorhamnose 3,5-epimerase